MTIRPTNSPATNYSVALLEEFVRLGVRDVVLSPGSRSQALALAAAEFEKQGLLRLRVRIDERVGGPGDLGQVVGRDVGRHAHGDAGRAVDEQVWQLGG